MNRRQVFSKELSSGNQLVGPSAQFGASFAEQAGIHKHFRMIALSEHLRNHGYDPRIEKHTAIPGIWAKLRTLYDLDVIDERENSFEYEEPKNKYVEFQLPLDAYIQEHTLERVLRRDDSQPASSPREMRFSRSPEPETAPKKRKRAETASKNRASTVDDTDATTTPAHSPPKSTRGARGGNKAVGRMKAESRSRQESKDTTGEEDEDDDAEETEDVDEDEEQDAEEDGSGPPSPKAKASSKGKPSAATTRKSRRKR